MIDANESNTFAAYGTSYQKKIVQALLSDYMFAEQMADIIKPEFFELKYLQSIVDSFYGYKNKYKEYPSPDLIEIMLTKAESKDEIVAQQIKEYVKEISGKPLNGDSAFVQATSLEFCRKQTLKEAVLQVIGKIEDSDYDSVQTIIRDALNKGSSRQFGHEYMECFDERSKQVAAEKFPSPWPIMDKYLGGGWEKKILVTFIGPTGAGKSMFMVNCGGAALEHGLNVVYVTLELAEAKIGVRFDSYFSGVDLGDVAKNSGEVEKAARKKVKGRLFIKEFPTKQATVQTIRSYLQRLRTTKNFKTDMLIVDYADLLKSSRGFNESRHELQLVYQELRGLAQELNMIVVTCDQTNRSGYDDEVVTLKSIAEAFGKATVCDVIFTISRRIDDKQVHGGRLFLAKSRLGPDGFVHPFVMNTGTVRATVLNRTEDPLTIFMEKNKNLNETMVEKLKKMLDEKKKKA